jgi:hypothetical protein
MTFQVKVIEDSISEKNGDFGGVRLTTLQLKYPRFIHAEFMTHRVFSRNASSSRAIPVAKMIEQVRNEPATPVHWGKNQSGMQAREELLGPELDEAIILWNEAADAASDIAEKMTKIGLHKQVANRILEPFQNIHVVVTATEWDNFFALRCHPAAQPEIQLLATMMHDAMQAHQPRILRNGEWHLPYIRPEERGMDTKLLIQASAARCARASYAKHDGTMSSIGEDVELYGQLVIRPYTDKRGNVLTHDDPIHASPIEHQATPMTYVTQMKHEFSGNLRGWHQYRKLFEGTCSS